MLIEKDKPFYNVNQVAELLGISADRLRTYDEEGLVFPHRQPPSNKRLYSELDIEWLKICRFFIKTKKMNMYSINLLFKFIRLIKKHNINTFDVFNKDEQIIIAAMINNPNFDKVIDSART